MLAKVPTLFLASKRESEGVADRLAVIARIEAKIDSAKFSFFDVRRLIDIGLVNRIERLEARIETMEKVR